MNDDEPPEPPADEVEPQPDEKTLLTTKELLLSIQKMNPGQKRVLALKGNAAVRKILLRDPNFEVQLAVANSPKATEGDIEQLATLASTSEVVLKTIASDGRWMKSYRIKRSLAVHPKTPMALATRCLRALTAHDLKKVTLDPNVRRPIAQAAAQMLRTRR